MRIAPGVVVFCLVPILIIHLHHVGHFDLESLGILMVVTFCVGVPLLQLSDLRRQFSTKFPNARKAVLDIDGKKILSTVSEGSEGRFPWSAVTDFVQNERMTLIYVDDNLLFVPTGVFSTSERAELNDLVARHVKR